MQNFHPVYTSILETPPSGSPTDNEGTEDFDERAHKFETLSLLQCGNHCEWLLTTDLPGIRPKSTESKALVLVQESSVHIAS
ncbi:hypothetical protein STEG23_027840 [Scotinomys teguina]